MLILIISIVVVGLIGLGIGAACNNSESAFIVGIGHIFYFLTGAAQIYLVYRLLRLFFTGA
jgi:hypothetical protein